MSGGKPRPETWGANRATKTNIRGAHRLLHPKTVGKYHEQRNKRIVNQKSEDSTSELLGEKAGGVAASPGTIGWSSITKRTRN